MLARLFVLRKKRILGLQRPWNSIGDCVGFWGGQIWLRRGGCGYSIMMLTMEAVGNGEGRRVEGFGVGGQGERNRQHWDDHQWDIVLVCLYCLPPFTSTPWVVESAANWLYGYQYWGGSPQNYHRPRLQLLEGQIQWGIMEQAQCWEVNKKLTWTKMWMRDLNASLVFRASISALQQEWNTRTSKTVDQRLSWMTLCC